MEINGWLSNDARRVSVRFVTCSELATMPQSQAPEPNETLYIQNLNESVTVPGTYMQEGSEGIKKKNSVSRARNSPAFRHLTLRAIVMKQSLEALFSNYGPVLSVVAHRNLRMRGQAFVSFQDVSTSSKALQEVNGFPLYGKSMVR